MKRILVFVSKTDDRQRLALVDTVANGRAQAEATLGLANWVEYDVTDLLRPRLDNIVNVARERAETRDGTGRWRFRTIANVLKRWLGEPVDENCERCGASLNAV